MSSSSSPGQSDVDRYARASAAESDRRRKFADLFERFRGRSKRLVAARLNGRLRNRFDESDELQETYLRVADAWDEYRPAADLSEFLWLRQVTLWTLADLQRKHLGVRTRDVRRELEPGPSATPSARM